jgi:glycosyltransferase involved in cell wall biosynthesis
MTDKCKIAIIGKLPPPYFGPAIATEILLNSSLNDHFTVVHFNSKINESASDIGKIKLFKFWKILFQYQSFKKFIEKEKPLLALIPVSQSRAGFLKDEVFFRLSQQRGVKTIMHLRGSELRDIINSSNPFIKQELINTIRSCNGVIVLGNNLRYIFNDLLPEEKIFVVPNGGNYKVPLKEYPSENLVKILFLSNLRESKGILNVIDAISLLSKKNNDFKVNIYGEWTEKKSRDYCLKKIKNEKLPVLIGTPLSKQKKMQEMINSDIFVFPPNAPEGHPWVIIEAMAAGLPIITTDRGAITESVINGVNGFIVRTNSPEEIAEKIRFLIDNPEERIRMGKESHRLYEENFTEEIMVKNLSKVFDTVLND